MKKEKVQKQFHEKYDPLVQQINDYESFTADVMYKLRDSKGEIILHETRELEGCTFVAELRKDKAAESICSSLHNLEQLLFHRQEKLKDECILVDEHRCKFAKASIPYDKSSLTSMTSVMILDEDNPGMCLAADCAVEGAMVSLKEMDRTNPLHRWVFTSPSEIKLCANTNLALTYCKKEGKLAILKLRRLETGGCKIFSHDTLHRLVDSNNEYMGLGVDKRLNCVAQNGKKSWKIG